MNYTLDSYAHVNFDEERQRILTASKRKLDQDNQFKKIEKEIRLRFLVLKFRFLRSSTKRKKDFFMAVIQNMDIKNLIAFIYYLNLNLLKIAKYEQALETDFKKDKILIDHDRCMDKRTLEETYQEDIEWITTIDGQRQLGIMLKLIGNCGNGIGRHIIIPCLRLYLQRLKESGLQISIKPSRYNVPEKRNDMNRYTPKQSIEVEKLRSKWEEMIAKYKREVESTRNKLFPGKSKKFEDENKSKKGIKEAKEDKTKGKKSKSKAHEELDRLQLLPIWIVKKIFNYLDQKNLTLIKKNNPYWKYACNSVLTERKAMASKKAAIEKMKAGLDPKLFEEEITFESKPKHIKSQGPTARRMEKLMSRGATVSKIKVTPTVKTGVTVSTKSLTEDLKGETDEFCYPFYRMALFPRFIRDDLVLYKNYRCPLKDINIYIDLEEDMKKYRETLSYSLSEKLSETLSFNELDQTDLEGW